MRSTGRHRSGRRTDGGWWLTDNTWTSCLWGGIGFLGLAAFSLIMNVIHDGSALPWMYPLLMLMIAAVWFTRARVIYVRARKTAENAGELVDDSEPAA